MGDIASGTFGVRLSLPNADYAIPAGVKCTMQFALEDKPDKQTTIPVRVAEQPEPGADLKSAAAPVQSNEALAQPQPKWALPALDLLVQYLSPPAADIEPP
jgi:hypothetical protein